MVPVSDQKALGGCAMVHGCGLSAASSMGADTAGVSISSHSIRAPLCGPRYSSDVFF